MYLKEDFKMKISFILKIDREHARFCIKEYKALLFVTFEPPIMHVYKDIFKNNVLQVGIENTKPLPNNLKNPDL